MVAGKFPTVRNLLPNSSATFRKLDALAWLIPNSASIHDRKLPCPRSSLVWIRSRPISMMSCAVRDMRSRMRSASERRHGRGVDEDRSTVITTTGSTKTSETAFSMSFKTLALCLACAGAAWMIATVTKTVSSFPRTGHVTTTSATLTLMLMQCKGDESKTEDNFCKGYIAASFDQLSLMKQICHDKVLQMRDVYSIGRDYLYKHAEPSDRQPGYLLAAAFREAYPCQER